MSPRELDGKVRAHRRNQDRRRRDPEAAGLRAEFGVLYDKTMLVLNERDPLGLIGLGAPIDEYYPEARTILPRLQTATSLVALRRIVHEEFVRWFGAEVAGTETRYDGIAKDLRSILSTQT